MVALLFSVATWPVVLIVLSILVVYFLYRVNRDTKPAPPGWQVVKPLPKTWRVKPQPPVTVPDPKPFEPLGDYLAGKLLPPEPRNPLPPERALPHVRKRKGKAKCGIREGWNL